MNKTPKLITNEKLMAEWDYEKNYEIGLFPEQLSTGSGYYAWWKCSKCCQSWKAQINSRNRGVGCPYCAGKKPILGINDLETKYPEIANEWHPTLNESLKPSDVTCGSGKKVWWICNNNHEYQASARDRVKGIGCSKCAAALKTSFPEQAVYYYIKKSFPDAINHYKDIFNNRMELDIYIPSIRTGIEYDGSAYHNKNSLIRDNKKYNICRENNIQLIRIYESSQSAAFRLFDRKIEVLNGERKYLNGAISLLCYKLGRPINVDIERDKFEILKYLTKINRTLSSEFPQVTKEWDYEKNYPLTPDNFAPHSNEIVWWICCYCGKRWKTSINSRTLNGDLGCKKCAAKIRSEKILQKKVLELGSLYDLFPEIMEEWDYERNKLDPKMLLPGSREKAYWKCKKCGYKWISPINKRTIGHGCLHCTKQAIIPGTDDLATLYPEVAEEWDFNKNDYSPNEVAPMSNKYAWWICKKCGFSWKAIIGSRVNKKAGCPCCSGRVPKEGENDFKTLYPKLALEWDFEANKKGPEKYVVGSHSRVSWKCINCGYTWKKEIRRRIKYPECPNCHVNILEYENQMTLDMRKL